ncbi:MAG TPA: hypothetical protein VGS27_27050 [Candidatus Sulfotelmatobacter sp.]|nr:hypothetical protein [Candidatus Sulfotelmatobacter sp.]
MRKAVQICGLILAICLASVAFAQTSVTLTGVSGQSYDGIYVSPYYATVGGTTTAVVCDDFADSSYIGSSWNAQTTSFSNVTSNPTSWTLAGQSASLYGAVGYLTNLVLTSSGNTQIIDTFALWAVFDPSGVESYLLSHPFTQNGLSTSQLCIDIFGSNGCLSTTAQAGSLLALAETYTLGQFSNLVVLSPDVTGTSNVCTAESTKNPCPAQEFVYVSVAEGGTAAAYLLLAGFCCLGAIFLHSRRRLAARMLV